MMSESAWLLVWFWMTPSAFTRGMPDASRSANCRLKVARSPTLTRLDRMPRRSTACFFSVSFWMLTGK